jgi:pyridoxamine 5'-phosphate oxidase
VLKQRPTERERQNGQARVTDESQIPDSARPADDADDFTSGEDPFALFEAWFADAAASEINDPNGMALATVDGSGLPNVRMVLLKGLDEAGHPARGFVFYTNLESAKGMELQDTSRAALLFHWKSLRRQIRVRGMVSPVSPEEADAYFATRPRLSQIGAWASDQSRPVESRLAFEKRIALYTAKYAFGQVPRPPHWSGFRVTPVEVELWHDRPFRLHDRIVFRRTNIAESWTKTRLYP